MKFASMTKTKIFFFSHPFYISWFLGSLLITLSIGFIIDKSTLLSFYTEDYFLLYVLMLSTSVIGFGALLGFLIEGMFLRSYCSKKNGAPFSVGERLMIVTGKYKGEIVVVNKLEVSQGGWTVVIVLFECEKDFKFADTIYEEYQLTRA